MPFAYALWMKSVERLPDVAREFADGIAQWKRHPSFSIVLYGAGRQPSEDRERSLRSVERQIYTNWKIVDETGEFHCAVMASTADYLVPLRVGDELSEAALFRFAEALQANSAAAILYGDQDELDERRRRRRPWFKPKWNSELFLAQDYLSSCAAIEMSLAHQVARETRSEDISSFMLTATSLAKDSITHVPHILCHVAGEAVAPPNRVAMVARHLEAAGATTAAGPFGTVKVEWPLSIDRPLVTIIIPTRDQEQLLRNSVSSILHKTDYQNFEILIIDNGSVEERTASFFKEMAACPKVRVLPYHEPFNYSAINNFAVGHARGTYLCLLNNDTEVMTPSWLTELMRYATRPDVGAAGAMLLYDDGSIQHAGVVVGIGEAAGHPHRFLPADEPGYHRMPHVAHFVSAVTGACLVVEKSKFEAVGGLDADKLAVAFNDVDLCLKLEAAGWRNVYVPHAVLVHHESKSRGSDMAPKQIDRYWRELRVLQERWGTKTYQDPLHNPNLDRSNETYVFRI